MPFPTSRLTRVVSVEFHEASNTFVVFQRPLDDDSVTMQRIVSKHFFITDNSQWLSQDCEVIVLNGDHPLRYLALHDSYAAYRTNLRTARERARAYHGEHAYDHIWNRNPVESFFTRSGISLFHAMQPDDLKVASLDLETYTSNQKFFSDAKDPDDKILLATLSDNRGQSALFSEKDLGEKGLIQAICQRVLDEDYDVICGHNLSGFDLPYLHERAQLVGVPLAIGRDRSILQMTPSPRRRNARGDMSFHIFGRHIIDTLPLLIAWDFTSRSLSNFQLKTAVFELGLSNEDRSDFDRGLISSIWDDSPEKLYAYAQGDAKDSLALYEFLTPAVFYQTQLLPLSYQQCVLTGTGTKVDLTMQRAYLQRAHSLPVRGALSAGDGTGGLTEARSLGWHTNVLKVDVASLYPSICLGYDIKPRTDNLNLFTQILGALTERRLEAKQQLKSLSSGTVEHRALDAMQNSFKILINSFYGMLGAGGLFFSDAEAGSQITTRGQQILLHMVSNIKDHGGLVIEIDTDGVYFSLEKETSPREVIELVSKGLHPAIKVDFDGHYEYMYSYAPKNYILVHKDKKVVKKGVVFRSRRLYGLQVAFIDRIIELLCLNDTQAVAELYHETRSRIVAGDIRLEEVVTTQTVDKTWESYAESRTKGPRSKALELVFGRQDRERWPIRSKVFYYHSTRGVDGVKLAQDFAEDVNTTFYLEVLKKTAEKFIYLFPPEQWPQVFGDYPLALTSCLWNFEPHAKPTIMEDYRRILKGDNQIRLF